MQLRAARAGGGDEVCADVAEPPPARNLAQAQPRQGGHVAFARWVRCCSGTVRAGAPALGCGEARLPRPLARSNSTARRREGGSRIANPARVCLCVMTAPLCYIVQRPSGRVGRAWARASGSALVRPFELSSGKRGRQGAGQEPHRGESMAPVASKRKKTLPPLVCALRCSSTPAPGSAQRRVLCSAPCVLRRSAKLSVLSILKIVGCASEWVSEMVQIINGIGRS